MATLLEGDSLTHTFIEQMRTITFQSGRRPGTAVGDECHYYARVVESERYLNITGWAKGLCRVGPCFLFYLARTLMVGPCANSSKLFYTMTKRKENNIKGPNNGLVVSWLIIFFFFQLIFCLGNRLRKFERQ